MTAPIDAYPLSWPGHWPRTKYPQRSRFDVTIAKARDGVIHELRLLGAKDIVISSNARLLRSGDIASRQGRIDDTGVAAYFTLDGHQRCIPADKWDRIEDNLRAVELTVAALRGLERWGAKQMIDAAFQGFEALPAGTSGLGWWDVLGVDRNATIGEINAAYRRLAMTHHPDRGGDDVSFTRINLAYEQAKATS